MRNFFGLLLLLLPVFGFSAAAAESTESSTSALASLPSCALTCLVQSASYTTCSLTNQTCLCTDESYQAAATICILANCTTIESLTAKNLTSISCNAPIRDKGHIYYEVTVILGVLSGFFVLVRCGYRLFIVHRDLASDDWLCLLTVIIGVPSTVMNIHGLVSNGLGRDVWTLPIETIYQFGKFMYVIEILYFNLITMIKLTMMVFYLRIFPSKVVRRVLWVTCAFIIIFDIVFIFLAIFQCHPVSYYWTSWDGQHEGTCIGINSIGWANAAISIAIDVWMLAIPLYQLRHLSLHWKKKVGVALMFCVGTFVTVVSILRLQSLLTFANSTNPTWDNFSVSNWSTIEINTGIICACMPSFRLFLVHFFPTLLGSSRAQNYYNDRYYGANSNGGTGVVSHNSRSRGPQQPPTGGIPMVVNPGGKSSESRSPPEDITRTTSSSTPDSLRKPDQRGIGHQLGLQHHMMAGFGNGLDNIHGNTANEPGNASDAANTGNNVGILYSKSYAVEYATEYHDRARLVHGQMHNEQAFDSFKNKSVFKTDSDSSS